VFHVLLGVFSLRWKRKHTINPGNDKVLKINMLHLELFYECDKISNGKKLDTTKRKK